MKGILLSSRVFVTEYVRLMQNPLEISQLNFFPLPYGRSTTNLFQI